MHVFPSLRLIWQTAAILALGALGGFAATWAHVPMPWMLGGLLSSALVILVWEPTFLADYAFPLPFRTAFVALIGVMIGTQVTAELVSLAGQLPWTMGGLVVFVIFAHLGNTLIFQRLGGYDRATAFYSGTPGGLMESIVMGEGAGADIRILTAQQFLRIIVVITLLPLGLSLWMGAPVGSAAGLRAASGHTPVTAQTLLLIFVAAGAGLGLARLIRLPAAQLSGPMILAALATTTGVLDLHLPVWLIAAAQLVIGVSLGMRFKGTNLALLRRCAWLALVSVIYMLILGGILSVILWQITGIEWLHLLISFSPGGVAEMSVVALSLAANPALVSLHHVARILMTVVELSVMARLLRLR
ncbi:putative ammonia monooxygenase [Antarctobacter heliothermus]|uniref:Putative ammonia monooxygenase n=1 Tax=Antarctobacter heliothermus TaxID=74033 RepID=A0A222E7P3_9RHOB|nr:AbrB family transcriptional regulator [Antarctobacter heliothermus]ASP22196.1 putative ammonia monooxygenase [Antarctobacter heliothermus]